VKPVAFEYIAAHSAEEAIEALARDEDAKPIAGGQSLVPALNMRLVRPTLLVDVNRAGLDTIESNGTLRIGATVRQAALEHDPRTPPLLREALPFVGHFVTRNRGTIGGSIAHADGSAEIPLCLLPQPHASARAQDRGKDWRACRNHGLRRARSTSALSRGRA
jgi:CO/xanthine dehydrogenase FAD-binding subunit